MSEPINSEKLITINRFETDDAFLSHIPEEGELNFVNIDNDSLLQNKVTNWGTLDYSAGTSLSSSSFPWTATKSGILFVESNAANTSLYMSVNGQAVGNCQLYRATIVCPVQKGDIVAKSSGAATIQKSYFYPFKGAD
jgi:hypothetical protein